MRLTEQAGPEKAQRGSGSTRRRWPVWMGLLLTGITLMPARAQAEGIPRDEGFMKEPKVVDYRKYLLKGKFDLGVFFDLSVKDQLTQHYGGAVSAAYNFNEFWALDLLLDGGYGGITSLTTQIREKAEGLGIAAQCTPVGMGAAMGPGCNDVAGGGALITTWQLGVRLTPIYGKLNLTAELPVHFNIYFVAGVGGALIQYNSIMGCASGSPSKGVCPGTSGPIDPATGNSIGDFHQENGVVVAGNVGLGMRFYITKLISIRLELRDILYPDRQYHYNNLSQPIDPMTKVYGNGYVSNPGVTQTPLAMFGVGFLL